MKTLYISDLDGTLLNSKGELSDYTKKKIAEFQDKNILFSIATARSMVTGKMLLGSLPFSAPVVLMNGVFIYDFTENKAIKYFEIESEPYRKVLELFKEMRLHPNVFTFDGNELSIWCEGVDTPAMEWFFTTRREMLDGRFYKTDSLEHLPQNAAPVYFNFFAPKEMLDPIAEKLNSIKDINFAFYPDLYTSGWLMEIFSVSASKADAMNYVKAYTGADRTVAFGDNLNDIPMLLASDRSVAVSNAVDEVKKIADIIIGENDSDSVVKFIEQEN